MLVVRENYVYYLLYFIKMSREIANNIIVIIKQQNLLFLIVRKLSLHLIYILFALNILQNALLFFLLYLIYTQNITRLLCVIYTIILI